MEPIHQSLGNDSCMKKAKDIGSVPKKMKERENSK